MKETKEIIAKQIVSLVGGEWKEAFHSGPGSTITAGCLQHIRDRLMLKDKGAVNLAKHIKEMENFGHEIHCYEFYPNGSCKVYLKNT